MGTKYTSKTIVGYNATPPSDDAATTENNRVKWASHKTKLADPIKTLAESMNSAMVAHVDETVQDKSVNYTTVAADHKRTINMTASLTISLGDVSTMGTGYIVTVKNSHTAANTVDLATATDKIDGVINDSYSLEPGQSMRFITNAAGDGYKRLSPRSDVRAGVYGTPNTTTGVNNHEYLSLPSWITKLRMSFYNVSLSAFDAPRVQLGISSGFVTSGYEGGNVYVSASAIEDWVGDTSGFKFYGGTVDASSGFYGWIDLWKFQDDADIWLASWNISDPKSGTPVGMNGGGGVDLGGTLDRIRFDCGGGINIDGGGKTNIYYE